MIIVGLDGTLRDNQWRLPTIEARGWEAYHQEAMNDRPTNVVRLLGMAAMWHALHSFESIVCVTGAPERYRKAVGDWMVHNRVHVHRVLMRPLNDWTPEPELKVIMARTLGIENVLLAIDDNDKVCEAYRAIGIPVLQWLPVNGAGNGLG